MKTKLPLRSLIDRGKEQQNGLGYDDFVKLMSMPPEFRPTVYAVAKRYKRNWRTVAGWFKRYEEEK